MQLSRVRALIDGVDRAIVVLLNKRATLVRHALVAKAGEPLIDPEREREMMQARRRWAKENGLDPIRTEAVFREILLATRP